MTGKYVNPTGVDPDHRSSGGWLMWLLVVFTVAVIASVIGWRGGQHYERAASREKVAQLRARQEFANRQWRRLVNAYANQGFPPGALEWTASKTLTFTVGGKPLKCVGLLRPSGDVRAISCDWDTWRQS